MGLGAVLAQEYPEGECPFAYLSHKLQPAEQRYSTIEREALAVKWAVTSWRYYLTDTHFFLVTDHAPLVWMEWLKDHNDRVQQWYLSLLPYSFTIRHRHCTQHANADCLSQLESWSLVIQHLLLLPKGVCVGDTPNPLPYPAQSRNRGALGHSLGASRDVGRLGRGRNREAGWPGPDPTGVRSEACQGQPRVGNLGGDWQGEAEQPGPILARIPPGGEAG